MIVQDLATGTRNVCADTERRRQLKLHQSLKRGFEMHQTVRR
jgi:hypothetical protein